MYAIGLSSIHGRGLFATRFIPAGTTVGILEGHHVVDDGPHVLWLDDQRGFHVTNDLCFINHSDTPNVAYFDDLTVGTLRDILPGEELTHFYGGDLDAHAVEVAFA